MAGVQAKLLPSLIAASQADGKASLKGAGVSSQSDQSSNSSGCSQGGSFQYFPAGSDLVSVSATVNPVTTMNDISHLLVSSANSSASGSSLTSGGSSVISGNSNLQQSVNMNCDSMASSGAAPVGLPASPLSFSSSNVGLPGSSGLPLSRSMVTPRSRLDAQQDPSVQPSKLLKIEASQQHGNEFSRQASQELLVNRQALNCSLADVNNGQQLLRFGQQFSGQGQASIEHLQNSEQHLTQLYPAMSNVQALRNDLLQQHQARQNIFQRPSSIMMPQMHRQEALQQQSQLVQAQILQQQRLLQQEQILRALPPQVQRTRFIQQQQQIHQLQQQIVSLSKNVPSGTFTRRLMQYMEHQRMRPADNNVSFWREFVSEYFTPHARKRWCLSKCTAGGGRQPTGVFPQDLWRCEICGSSPGRGFEATVDVMPRLCKTKFDNGELEELLFVDLPHEYKLSSGLTVLEYGKAVQESVFENLRVVWEGQLRLIFTPDLKILSWDFCAKSHEELLPRRSIVPQVNQLVMLASKYQGAMAQSNGSGISIQDLQASCNMFVSSARQLGKSLEPPFVNELGFTKRFVRCIQIAEVVNSMKDLMDFSHENGMGPIESLEKFPRQKAFEDMSNVPTQPEPVAVAPFLAESNSAFLTSMHINMAKQASTLSRPANGHMSPLPPLQTFLRRNSHSFIQSDPSVMGALPGAGPLSKSMQASPTSSLTSLQSSVTSLNPNQPSCLSSFESPISGRSGSINELQQPHLQGVHGNQQNLISPAQHILQGLRNPQLGGGALFHAGSSCNDTENAMIATLSGHGSGGMISSGNVSGIMGGIGGMSDNYVANIGGNGINLGLRHLGANLSQMGNTGARMQGSLGSNLAHLGNAASLMQGGRLNFGSLSAQPELPQTLGFGGADLANHSYDWK